ncbi:MerR family transcriptional regulator [Paenibacillus illinoisensis]|uniref:MerR family transcriptional regulator n=1 Tax=Paenibacillus illinoisensis TaxID=59845 RepID=A0A2W0CBU7_9BACL|nr:MerR family transcriptional regulator [Paenibacillus illinoisensis]PYY28129.1 MerR family transcriptional regulator [Paenibacillus illinoisensis]
MSNEALYSIKETAEKAGLSEDTIRYYEKIQLLPRADRKANRHRVYRQEDIRTMKLISCLKKTGMSLEDMKPYLHMSMDSNLDEFPEEREMLVSHRMKIEAQIASLQQVVDFIDEKLNKRSLFPDECPITGENQMSVFEKKNIFS